ncbi:MAG: hypothetical protein QHH18_04525 [Candidatus Bathyarchaeota archaeon]|nr:hypothetical protein [Candidatus Bathyarchaeota archaeon A05DMB-5]MDH7557853.1 hypothetical protein [Candidatus Bathyarchaeota archaeon]
MKHSEILIYIGLLAILVLGTYIRLIPILDISADWLADLDPYRNLRAVNEVLSYGRMPLFDALSAAPNGTYATYSTSQGYYMLSSALTLISGANASAVLSFSPVICEVALLLTVYVFGTELTNSRWAGLFAAFFVAIPRGWAMISLIGTCPLAENFGGVVFPLVLFLFWKCTVQEKKSFLLFSGLLLGISLLIHPVTYFYLVVTIFVYVVLMCLAEKRGRMLVIGFEVLLISLFAVLIQFFSVRDFAYLSGFTHGALWLASIEPVYPVIDFYVVLYNVGELVVFLSLMAILLIFLERKWNYLILVSGSIVMFGIIALSLITPLRQFLADIPFGAFIILSHRVMMPYLPLVLSLLGGIFIAEYLLPLVRINNKPKFQISFKKGITTFVLLVVLIAISLPSIQSSVEYSTNYKWAYWAKQYVSLLKWAKDNTNASDVFLLNEISLGELVKTIAERPTVFTISYQDLATPDLVKRMWLQSSVFIKGYDDNIAQRLLYDFNVSYVIVVKNQSNLNILNKKYVFPAPDDSFLLYLQWMDSKKYLERIYSNVNLGFYVYFVHKDRLFNGEISLPKVAP